MGANDTEHLYPSAASAGKAAGSGFSGPLPPTVQQRFEAAFGADLSAVTVHVNHAATLMGADAFTVENDIFFAPAAYSPFSNAGQQILGHELAHVVQQSGPPGIAEAAGQVAAGE
jgi:hypothetical protein